MNFNYNDIYAKVKLNITSGGLIVSSRNETFIFGNSGIKGTINYKTVSGKDSSKIIDSSMMALVFNVSISDEIIQAMVFKKGKDNFTYMYSVGNNSFPVLLKYLRNEEFAVSDKKRITCIVILWENTEIWLDKQTQTIVKKETKMPDGSWYYKIRVFID